MKIKCQPAVESSIKFLLERYEHARCDSDGVSNCVRCQVVFLAKSVREMLAEPEAQPMKVYSTDECEKHKGNHVWDMELRGGLHFVTKVCPLCEKEQPRSIPQSGSLTTKE